MAKYRVDVSLSLTPPVGMNSIRYLGDSYNQAVRVFNATYAGKDAWNEPSIHYGVILTDADGKVLKRKMPPCGFFTNELEKAKAEQ